MNKLIIRNKTDLGDLEAVDIVRHVINEGRISNEGKQYCYITVISTAEGKFKVCAYRNKESDGFIISRTK